jgi:hypothetical protein
VVTTQLRRDPLSGDLFVFSMGFCFRETGQRWTARFTVC